MDSLVIEQVHPSGNARKELQLFDDGMLTLELITEDTVTQEGARTAVGIRLTDDDIQKLIEGLLRLKTPVQ